MISVREAQLRILSNFEPLGTIHIPFDTALGHILTQPIHSGMDLPLFNNSSVDGFAVRAEDVSDIPASLDVVADIPAGNVANISISKGQAARIMTGAPIPDGADAVVMVEDTDAHQHPVGSAAPASVKIFKVVQTGEYIRKRGADILANQEILPAGSILRPQDIGMLAMLGISSVPVRRKPRVALISSGDELIPVDAPLTPGKIHDSNTYMLAALLQKAGCEVLPQGVAADRFEAVQKILLRAVETKPDLIISSAGVSAGAFDYIKDVVESSGSLNFWKVDMRPGKPLAFGSYCDIPFFGLPGNPVSSFVSFLVFVQPVLDILKGLKTSENPRIKVVLNESFESDGRESYLRAVVQQENGQNIARLTGHQGSGNLFSLVEANALLVIPAGTKSCPPGSEVEAWMLEN
ncbi:MAG: molybdopterin molybdotransferase MoeA [Chloroflexi bacterium]|nr:molybdopterin molybdotransferase MoeA [Chloroflexota bacterium]